jgi:hypothetical protein
MPRPFSTITMPYTHEIRTSILTTQKSSSLILQTTLHGTDSVNGVSNDQAMLTTGAVDPRESPIKAPDEYNRTNADAMRKDQDIPHHVAEPYTSVERELAIAFADCFTESNLERGHALVPRWGGIGSC